MKLRYWLFKHNISLLDLSKKTDISQQYLSALSKERKKPLLKTAKIISKATNGEVSIEEILNPELFPDPY